MLKSLLTRLRFLVLPRSRREVDEELRFHLEAAVDANVARGMTPEEARRQAMIAFGGVEAARAECAAERPSFPFETVAQDVRYVVRGFGRNRVFATTVIATLMLGIGCTTAVFSVVDRILFRSLPYEHADRMVSVGLMAPIEPNEFMLGGSYYTWRDNQTPFEVLTSDVGVAPCDLTEERPARLNCASVESTFLPAFSIRPVLGRVFTKEEDQPDAPHVALISYALWRSHFGGDPGVLNRLISLDGRPTRVVGVLPATFEMPTLEATDVVMPEALDEAAQRKADPGRPMWAFGRLKPGVSIAQAKAELEPVFNYSLRLAPAPFRKEVHLQVRSLRDRQVQNVRLIAWVLSALALAVLLISCANVTSLLLARGANRARELAVRSALGASRARLTRQALTEAAVLSIAGGAAGYLFAELLLHVLVAIAPEGMLFLTKAHLDLRIVCFTFLLSLLCAVVFGLVPALERPRAEVLGGRTALAGAQGRLRQWLVAGQIAASLVLLAGSALLYRSFANLESQQLGMRTQSVITAGISLGEHAYGTQQRQMAFFEQLEQSMRYKPGVLAIAESDTVPPGGRHRDQVMASLQVDGRPRTVTGTGGLAAWRWITPEYFRTLGIPLVRGRDFTEADRTSTDHFVILSRTLAARLFPNEDALGKRLHVAAGAPDDPSYTVVGIAADVKNGGLAGGDEPEYYRLRRHQAEDWDRGSTILVQTTLAPRDAETWIRAQVGALDPTVPVTVETLSQRVDKMADQPRFETLLVGLFAATGLLLAVVGLYGVVSFLVAQRTQEIGVRIALGATKEDVLRLVMAKGVRLVAVGVGVGLVVASLSARVLRSLLFSVGAGDPVAFLVATGMLVLVALLAILVPARAATRVDPMEALRSE